LCPIPTLVPGDGTNKIKINFFKKLIFDCSRPRPRQPPIIEQPGQQVTYQAIKGNQTNWPDLTYLVINSLSFLFSIFFFIFFWKLQAHKPKFHNKPWKPNMFLFKVFFMILSVAPFMKTKQKINSFLLPFINNSFHSWWESSTVESD